MNPRMAIASSLAGQAPSDQPAGDGQVVESKQHEDAEGQAMAEILATVKDIQGMLKALMGAEQQEAVPQGPPQGQMPPMAGGQ